MEDGGLYRYYDIDREGGDGCAVRVVVVVMVRGGWMEERRGGGGGQGERRGAMTSRDEKLKTPLPVYSNRAASQQRMDDRKYSRLNRN